MRFSLALRVFAVYLAASAPIGLYASDSAADIVSENEGSGIEIRSEPSGADVYLNGVLRGKTPLEINDRVPGAQVLRLEKDGYWTKKTVLMLPPGKRLIVYLELAEARGILKLEAVPAGAGAGAKKASSFRPLALIDGDQAEIGANDVKEGFHTARVRAFGFEDETLTVFVGRGETETVRFVMRPAEFRIDSIKMSRRRFNPRNPGILGTSTLSFAASAPGKASLTILAKDGTTAFSAELPLFETWEQEFSWEGEYPDGTPVSDGWYKVVVAAKSADASAERTLETRVAVDSDISIRPAAVSGDIGGLLFAPDARTIPEGSFQFDSTFFFGRPYGSFAAFKTPPFAFGLRFSPYDRIEAAGTLRLEAAEDDSETVSFGFSAKRAFIAASAGRPFALSAAVRWGYAAANAVSAFGAPSGVELALPMELVFAAAGSLVFSAHVSPSLLWAGAGGLPESAMPAPAASAGLEMRGTIFSAAVSSRTETAFGNGNIGLGPILIGCEARFFPPPSMFVLSLMGGMWQSSGQSGVFAGGGLGILY